MNTDLLRSHPCRSAWAKVNCSVAPSHGAFTKVRVLEFAGIDFGTEKMSPWHGQIPKIPISYAHAEEVNAIGSLSLERSSSGSGSSEGGTGPTILPQPVEALMDGQACDSRFGVTFENRQKTLTCFTNRRFLLLD
ncbi:MAG: hypothetical protein IPK15_15310 [Verrucomicrobia bacterium]|nr:hypothetical protein [Verrucomicrobiota bacterium]